MTKPPYPEIPTAITRHESDLLAELTAGKCVLEIGSYLGYSTVWMALNGAEVHAVDPHDWMDSGAQFVANVLRYHVEDRVFDVRLRSQDLNPNGLGPHFEAAFIDGDHSEEQATFDIRLALALGVEWVICHDYAFPGWQAGGWPGVVTAINQWLKPRAVEVRRAGTIFAARVSGAAPTAPGS